VVLESEIRQRTAESKVWTPEEIKEKLERLKKNIEWHELEARKIRFFVMSRHPELFRPLEFRKTVRLELEKFRDATAKVVHDIRQAGAIVTETDDGFTVTPPKDCDLETNSKLAERYAELLNKNGISADEIYAKKRIEADLLGFLGEGQQRSTAIG